MAAATLVVVIWAAFWIGHHVGFALGQKFRVATLGDALTQNTFFGSEHCTAPESEARDLCSRYREYAASLRNRRREAIEASHLRLGEVLSAPFMEPIKASVFRSGLRGVEEFEPIEIPSNASEGNPTAVSSGAAVGPD
jgi:hypothetical protein